MIKAIFEIVRNIGAWLFLIVCCLELTKLNAIEIESAKQIFNIFIVASIGIYGSLNFLKTLNVLNDNKFLSRVKNAKSIRANRRAIRISRLLLVTLVNSFIFYLLILIFQNSSKNIVDIIYLLPSQFFIFLELGDLLDLATEG